MQLGVGTVERDVTRKMGRGGRKKRDGVEKWLKERRHQVGSRRRRRCKKEGRGKSRGGEACR